MKTLLSETPKENNKSHINYTRPNAKNNPDSHSNEDLYFKSRIEAHKPTYIVKDDKKR